MSEQMYEDVAPTWQQDAMRGRLASHIINALRRNAPAIREAMPKDAYGWATLPAKATVAMARGVGNEIMDLAQKQRAAIESGDMEAMNAAALDNVLASTGAGLGLSRIAGPTGTVLGAGVGAKVKALRGTIPDIAESYAERAKETLGPDWNVSVANSHTPIGKSSYVKVGRADNGTSVNKELRVSDHSTGPLRSKDYDLHVDSLDVDKMAEWDAILKDATSRWDFRPSQTEILQRNISRAEKELSVDGQTWGASRKKEAKKRLAAMKARALQDVENLDDKK